MNSYKTITLRAGLILFLVVTTIKITFAQVKKDSWVNPGFAFIENRGQVRDQFGNLNSSVLYSLPLPGNTIHLKATGFSYDTRSFEKRKGDSKQEFVKGKHDSQARMKLHRERRDQPLSYHRVDIEFVGANADVQIIAAERAQGYINCTVNGRELSANQFTKIVYKNLYPNIDVEFLGRPGSSKPVEYNFIVHPGGDIRSIKMRYRGATANQLKGGKLALKLTHGSLTESIPASYWQKSKESVNIRYREISNKNNEILIGFEGKNVSKRDQALVIDPVVNPNWTYTHGNIETWVMDLVVDKFGNTFLTGEARDSFLATTGAHQTVLGGGVVDAFILKLNSNGGVAWATFFGGPGGEWGHALAVDNSGNCVVVGNADYISDLSTSGVFQENVRGAGDPFIAKFSASGTLLWSTYYGTDTADDQACAVAIGSSGTIFFAGVTSSANDSTLSTSGTHQAINAGFYDIFLAAFSADGTSRLWGTYFGGEQNEGTTGSMVVEPDGGGLYFASMTGSVSGIATSGAHLTTRIGDANGYLAKFNPANGTLHWATYYGGAGTYFLDVALDKADNVIALGNTEASTGIATSGTHQSSIAGLLDVFVVKFNSSGVRLWGTYYGGAEHDWFGTVAVDSKNDIYLCGMSMSSSGISTPDGFITSLPSSGLGAFIAKLSKDGIRQWGTYTQPMDPNSGLPYLFVQVDPNGKVIHGGNAYNATHEAFVTKYTQSNFSCRPPDADNLLITQTKYLCASQFSSPNLSACGVDYRWDFGDGDTLSGRTVMHAYQASGNYTVTLKVKWDCNSACQGDTTITKQITATIANPEMDSVNVEVNTDRRSDVLAAGASTYSDVWSLKQFSDYLDNKNSFANGTSGVWRNRASFAHKKPRVLSPTTTLATDGTFVLDRFSWQSIANIIPGWIEGVRMTHYSPFSYELENKDVLGIYTATLYDYGGHLVAASGANMRHDEMAFTGFEFVDGTVGGNWILDTEPIPSSTQYEVGNSNGKIAVVEASLEDLTNVTSVAVTAYSIHAPNLPIYYQYNEIICMVEHPDNPEWTLAVLKEAPADIWSGMLKFKNTVTPSTTGLLDATMAHTGKKSLKVTADQTFKQDLLKLIAGKAYWINCWASVNNAGAMTPTLAGNPTIEIIAKAGNHQVVQTFVFTPAGPLIEGWQQIKGSFTFPSNAAYIEIKFDTGSATTVWYDDLRLQPENGNMKGYVYDLNDYRLKAVLDEENFASYFYYDQEGNLYLTKKETIDGIKTISENVSYTKEVEP